MARFLTAWIQKRFPDLNPQMTVGHGDFDAKAGKAGKRNTLTSLQKESYD